VKIDVLEDGTVHIFSTSGAGGDQGAANGSRCHRQRRTRQTYLGKVVRLAEFGGSSNSSPAPTALLHISEISEHRIRDVRDELKLGDQVLVKVLPSKATRSASLAKPSSRKPRKAGQKRWRQHPNPSRSSQWRRRRQLSQGNLNRKRPPAIAGGLFFGYEPAKIFVLSIPSI